MKYDDFKTPRPGWRQIEDKGTVLYVPHGISRVGKLWRVTVNNVQEYEPNLRRAWFNLKRRLPSMHRQPAHCGPRKAIDTGVIGVSITVAFRKGYEFVVIKASQSTSRGPGMASCGQCPLHQLNQQWLNAALIRATGVRWYSLSLKRQNLLDRIVRVHDVPREVFPDKPVRSVPVDEVYQLADARREAQSKR